jgi:hypothetical protein
VDRQVLSFRHDADAGGGDEDPVALAAINDLGVPRDQDHPGHLARLAHRADDAAQVFQRQPLLQDEGGRQELRHGAADGEVVDRAVDRQLADVAAGEEQGAHHKRVGGQRDARAAGAVALAVQG